MIITLGEIWNAKKIGFMKKILNYFGHDEFNVPM